MIIQLLDLLIGLALTYMIFSAISSALVELLEARLKRRARLLEQGVRELIERAAHGDPARRADGNTLVKAFYESPHIFSLFRGDYAAGAKNLPSYVPGRRFAAALQELAERSEDFKRIAASLLHVANIGAAADAEAQRAALAAYFEENMQRVTGWYRRQVQRWLFFIGLALAAAFNVDTLRLIHTLSQDAALREQVVASALKQQPVFSAEADCSEPTEECEAALLNSLDSQLAITSTLGLPIGWAAEEFRLRPYDDEPLLSFLSEWLARFSGWLLTALALMQGAPFWFDLLNRLTNLRTSVKPTKEDAQKSGDTKTVASP